MKEEFVQYLKTLSMQDVLIKRVEALYDSCQQISRAEIKDVFVTDSGAGSLSAGKGFGNLWFFTDRFLMEMKYFATSNDFDILPLTKHIAHCEISHRDYDFNKPTEKSKLNLRFTMVSGHQREAHATKDNCTTLKNIVDKYVIPNIND